MLEWIQGQFERLARRVQFWIAVRLHPELKRIDDEDDRMWALWFAGADPPGWQRVLWLVCVLLVGPAAVTFAVFLFADTLGMRWRGVWLIMFVASWIGGFLATGALIELVRDRSLHSRYFLAMRIFGHDVCLRCGYGMEGHAGEPWTPRTCPECGAEVPPVESTRSGASPSPPGPDRVMRCGQGGDETARSS